MPNFERADGRMPDQLRPISFEAGFAPHATGSVLIAAGNSPLGTVLLTRGGGFGQAQYQLYDAGKPGESGFLTK